MLNKKLETRINQQIHHELYSAYLYLSMAAYCEAENLPGFANWMRKQSEEEVEHAMKFFAFVNARGGRVILEAISQPPADFGTPLEVFEAVLAHEQKVTALIHELYALALAENDYATQVELHWFIEEQVEEEENAGAIVEQLRMVGDHKNVLLMLDRQLAGR